MQEVIKLKLLTKKTEVKGFKYQITLVILLNKIKPDGNTKYSTTKTVINNDFRLDLSFQQILYRIGLMKDLIGLLKKYFIST